MSREIGTSVTCLTRGLRRRALHLHFQPAGEGRKARPLPVTGEPCGGRWSAPVCTSSGVHAPLRSAPSHAPLCGEHRPSAVPSAACTALPEVTVCTARPGPPPLSSSRAGPRLTCSLPLPSGRTSSRPSSRSVLYPADQLGPVQPSRVPGFAALLCRLCSAAHSSRSSSSPRQPAVCAGEMARCGVRRTLSTVWCDGAAVCCRNGKRRTGWGWAVCGAARVGLERYGTT